MISRKFTLFACSFALLSLPALPIEKSGSPFELSTLEKEDSEKVLDVLLEATGLRRFKFNDNAETQSDFSKRLSEWMKRRGFEPELERLRKDPTMVKIVPFIEKILAFDGKIPPEDIGKLQMTMPGNQDELLMITCSVALDSDGQFKRSILQRIFLPDPNKANNPIVVLDLFGTMVRYRFPNLSQEKAAVDSLEIALKEGYFDGKDAEFFASEVIEHVNRLRTQWDRLEKIVKDSSLPEWLKETFYGELESERAWKERGNGFANEVTNQGWGGFASHLKSARGHLEKAWALEPNQPYAAATMVGVAVSEGPKAESLPVWFDKTLLLWFDRAIAARIDLPAAFSRLANAMQGKWYGSNLHQLTYGMLCFESRRFDSDMPYQFWSVVDQAAKSSVDPLRFYRIPGIADRYVELGKQAVARADLQHLQAGFKAALGVRAWMAGKYSVAAENLTDDAALVRTNVLPMLAEVEADILTFQGETNLLAVEETLKPYNKVLESFRQKQPRVALDGLNALEVIAPENSKSFIERLREVAGWEKNIADGDWVKIPYRQKSHGWIFPEEQPRSQNFKLVVSAPNRERRFRGIWTGRIGNRYEFRGNVELSEVRLGGGEQVPATEFGVLFERSVPGRALETRSAFTVEVRIEQDNSYTCSIAMSGNKPIPGGAAKPVKAQKENHFLFRQDGRKITFIWNDEEVFQDVPLPPEYELQDEPYFGLGWRGHPRVVGATTTISGLEARMLPPAK